MNLSRLSMRLSFGWIIAKGTSIIERGRTKNPLSSIVSEVNYGAAFGSRCVRPVAGIAGSSKAPVNGTS